MVIRCRDFLDILYLYSSYNIFTNRFARRTRPAHREKSTSGIRNVPTESTTRLQTPFDTDAREVLVDDAGIAVGMLV